MASLSRFAGAVAGAAVLLLSACGDFDTTWSATLETAGHGYPGGESARIDEDLRRLGDDKPLKHHDDEEELRRHAFERDFYESLHDDDD